MTNTTVKQTVTDDYLEEMILRIGNEELQRRYMNLSLIQRSPLFIPPPSSVEDSYQFGWARGLVMMTETLISGRWANWLHILQSGRLDKSEPFPELHLSDSNASNGLGKAMLKKCMNMVYSHGLRVESFLDWIGYSLGIAWFNKPEMPERLWIDLYQTFNFDLLIMFPDDYLSHFLCEHGASGIAGYYPTPMNLTRCIHEMLGGSDPTMSYVEPCLGAGAMLLPTSSYNLCGNDINLLMCKASSVQAFLYLPWLLYVPYPIIGLHYCEQEKRINKYFEFNTNTRIYQGDSLIGELTAPKDIFTEDSDFIEVYLHPLDLAKREIFRYESLMQLPWNTIATEDKWKIVAAQARELPFDTQVTNPPFGNTNKYTMERINLIDEKNKAFLSKRQSQTVQTPTNRALNAIVEDVEVRVKESQKGQLELVLF